MNGRTILKAAIAGAIIGVVSVTVIEPYVIEPIDRAIEKVV